MIAFWSDRTMHRVAFGVNAYEVDIHEHGLIYNLCNGLSYATESCSQSFERDKKAEPITEQNQCIAVNKVFIPLAPRVPGRGYLNIDTSGLSR